MPRGLNNWLFGDVVHFLRKRGFVHSHTRGSHFYYVRKNGGMFHLVTVPLHAGRSIHPKTLKSIILQSGIDQKEWTG